MVRTSVLLLSLCNHLLSPSPALLHLLNFSLSSSQTSQAPPIPVHRSLPPSLILYLSPSLFLPFISPPAIQCKPARFHSLSPLTLCAPSSLLLVLSLSLSLLVAPLLSSSLLSAFAEESGPVGTKTDSVFGGKTLCVCVCVRLKCIVFVL